ncbi:unnamed protein product, partial [Sphenostylis stenocarpa]
GEFIGETKLVVSAQLVIHFNTNKSPFISQGRQPLVTQAPSPFPYKDNKAVPWRYSAQEMNNGQHEETMNKVSNVDTSTNNNISSIGNVARSGRFSIPLK